MTFAGFAKKLCKAAAKHHEAVAAHHDEMSQHHAAIAEEHKSDNPALHKLHAKCSKAHAAHADVAREHAAALHELAGHAEELVDDRSQAEKVFRQVESSTSPTDDLDPELADLFKTQ